jgi:hypothetical protein
VIVLDASALTALHRGHRVLHGYIDQAALSPLPHFIVPALSLMQAEIDENGAGRSVLALPALHVEELGQVAALTVGELVREGHGSPDLCHAIECSVPSITRPDGAFILTAREEDYPPGIVAVSIDHPGLK